MFIERMLTWRSVCLLPLLMAMPILSGCGPPTCDVVGTVKYDGQLLNTGLMRFRPVGAGHNGGGFAKIESGKYSVVGLSPGEYHIWVMSEKNTGRKVRREEVEPGESPMEDEVIQFIPMKYNIRTELVIQLALGENEHNFDLEGK